MDFIDVGHSDEQGGADATIDGNADEFILVVINQHAEDS